MIYEMYCIFNCGVGLVIVVDEVDVDIVLFVLNDVGEDVWLIGGIVDLDGNV